MQILDYSPIYYEILRDSPVPPQRTGKYLYFHGPDGDWLVLSPQGLSLYHADIARRFLASHGVEGRDVDRGMNFVWDDVRWRTDGGGKWTIDEQARQFRLFSYSGAYGRADHNSIAERLSGHVMFDGYSVNAGN